MNGNELTLIEILFTFATALFLVICFTPIAMKLAIRFQIVDKPNSRKTHKVTVPYLGGVAIYFAFLVACTVFIPISKEMLGILVGGTILMLVGAIDDKIDLSAKLRLVIQIACAILVVKSGVVVEGIGIPFSSQYFDLGAFSVPVSVIWIVTVTNVMNFIDGLDGLAAGTAAISSITLMIVAWRMNYLDVVVMSVALAGACLGFLFYNFHPAKIFMGDSGSLFLGFTLACLSIKGPMKGATFATILVPLLALGVPLFDTVFVFAARIKAGSSPMKADRRHIHHILYDSGLTQKQTVLFLYAISTCLGLAAVEMNNTQGRIVALVVGLLGMILFIVARTGRILEKDSDTKGYENNFQKELQEELKRRRNEP